MVEEIKPDDLLWRRLHEKHVVKDAETGEERISTAAFTDPKMSVDLARLVEGDDFRVTMQNGAGVAEFAASTATKKGLTAEHSPEPDNHAHCLVLGKKTQSIQRHLQKNSRLWRRDHW